MAANDLPKPDYAKNMRLVGWNDQGGRSDGVQIMLAAALTFEFRPEPGGIDQPELPV